MIGTKTHLFNVTYLGQPIYDVVQEQVASNKKLGLLNRADVGAIFAEFANAFAKESKEVADLLPQMISYLGSNIIPGWLSFSVRNILATVSMSAEPFYISGELINTISRGYIEQPQGNYKSRGCLPLRNIYAQGVLERIHEAVELEKATWIKKYCGDEPSKAMSGEAWYTKVVEAIYFFLESTKDGVLRLGGFGSWTPEEVWEGLTFPAHSETAQLELNTRKKTRADYYWDKKGRLGFIDEAISLNFGKSGFSDKDNMMLRTISLNDKKKAAGALDKDVCSLCEAPFKRTNNRQKFCKECGPKMKAVLNKLKGQDHRAHREGLGSVPCLDQPFARYLSNKTHHSYTKADLVPTKELRPKTTKVQRKELHGEPDTCECGGCNFEIYKPWKPDDTGKFGKIGSKVLYCKDCGLVVGHGVRSN